MFCFLKYVAANFSANKSTKKAIKNLNLKLCQNLIKSQKKMHGTCHSVVFFLIADSFYRKKLICVKIFLYFFLCKLSLHKYLFLEKIVNSLTKKKNFPNIFKIILFFISKMLTIEEGREAAFKTKS